MKQLFKQIVNERKSNRFIFCELLLVFVILWYILDYGYVTYKTVSEPLGFDISNTYFLHLALKDSNNATFIPKGKKETTLGSDLLVMKDRLTKLPEIEAASISINSRPYIGSNSGINVCYDTLRAQVLHRPVTPDFFKVFRYQSSDGKGYQPLVEAIKRGEHVVSENLFYRWGQPPLLKNKTVVNSNDSTELYQIGAVSKVVRYSDFYSNYGNQYLASYLNESYLSKMDFDYYPMAVELCFRVKEHINKDIPTYLMKLSDDYLNVGNLYIVKVEDYMTIKRDYNSLSINEMKKHIGFIFFLLINIFLGIIGTFWFRTQYRKSEIALRMAIGSSRSMIWLRTNMEGVMLLSLAAILALPIAYNIGFYELTKGALPWGVERFVIGVLLTYLFMLLMIVVGVWFPARRAMLLEPAEVLRDE